MDTNEFLDPFDRLLGDVCTSAAIRAVEGGADWKPMWEAIAESGFLDALVSEGQGGFGLSLAQVGPLLMAVGRHAVPVPVGETMLARHLLAAAGIAYPAGPIMLLTAHGEGCGAAPCRQMAGHVLKECGGELVLAVTGDLAVEPGGARLTAPAGGMMAWAAGLRACLISGAAERLLEMTVAYANERVQFGKPIGRQQALQQNLAVMAEQVIAIRLATQTFCAAGLPVDTLAAAAAKQVASVYAPLIANTAHAIHGAIGISKEHDLQLLTRRLHGWRLADGAEGLWARRLGEARLASPLSTVDFLREMTASG